MGEQPSSTTLYGDCVKEAYLDSIQSVTIVDDKYPTLRTLIAEYSAGKLDKWDETDISRLQAVIDDCIGSPGSKAVEVYDGQNPDISSYSHISNSDLVVLDYHLTDDETDGAKALEILSTLNSNNHFNQVVIHTDSDEPRVKQIFIEVIRSCSSLPDFQRNFNSENVYSELCKKVADLEIESKDFESIYSDITSFDALEFCKGNSTKIDSYKSAFEAFAGNLEVTIDDFLWCLVGTKLESDNEHFIGSSPVYNWHFDDRVNWISTDKLFITVLRKNSTEEPPRLLERLHNALAKSQPSPLLLLMAKMRFELEVNGIVEATKIANSSHIQAGWLYELLEDQGNSVDGVLDKHWERISNAVKPRLNRYLNSLVSALQADSEKPCEVIKNYLNVDIVEDRESIFESVNAYNCSTDVISMNLKTGSILEFGEDDHWICLTPACDMVFSQKKVSDKARLGEGQLAFLALKLKREENCKAVHKGILKNKFVIVEYDQKFHSFSLFNLPEHPVKEEMFLNGEGLIKDAPHWSSEPSWNLKVVSHSARVVAELRYEYALNLLQKYGASASRVGLDFTKSVWV